MNDFLANANDGLADYRTMTDKHISEFVCGNLEAIVAAVCTEDGFVISQTNSPNCDAEADKLASVSSTLLSLCDAAVQIITTGELRLSVVEAESVNLVFCRAKLRSKPVVVTAAVSNSVSIGHTLFLVNRLVKKMTAE
ncbi:MAG: roadblock/LC7 domain-containing protein [Marinobacter sp.]